MTERDLKIQVIRFTLQIKRNLNKNTGKYKNIGKGIFLILLVSIFLILSSCQSKPTAVETPEPTATTRATRTPKNTPLPTLTPTATPQPDWFLTDEDLKDTKINLVHPWSDEIAIQMDALVSRFNSENQWGIQVTAYGIGSAQQVFQQSEAGIAIGNGPQIVVAPVEELAYWFKQGHLLSLNKFVQDPNLGLDSKRVEDFHPQFWQQDFVNDEQLGIPVARDIHFLLYNQTWAQELGFQNSPANVTEFTEQTCAAGASLLQDKPIDNNGMGGWIIDRDDYVLLSWLRGFGISDFPEQETVYEYNQPQTIETFEYLKKLFDDGCAWVGRNPTAYDYFANRQALFISADLNDLALIASTMQLAGNKDQWVVLPYLSKNNGPVVIPQGSSFGIMRSSKAQELASWLFIRWMIEPDQQNQLANANIDLPVTQTLLTDFSKKRSKEWQSVVLLLERIQAAPRTSDWRIARFVLPDAFYQILQIHILPEQFPEIVKLLDATILSLVNQPATPGWLK